jgi:hypothetical protein
LGEIGHAGLDQEVKENVKSDLQFSDRVWWTEEAFLIKPMKLPSPSILLELS